VEVDVEAVELVAVTVRAELVVDEPPLPTELGELAETEEAPPPPADIALELVELADTEEAPPLATVDERLTVEWAPRLPVDERPPDAGETTTLPPQLTVGITRVSARREHRIENLPRSGDDSVRRRTDARRVGRDAYRNPNRPRAVLSTRKGGPRCRRSSGRGTIFSTDILRLAIQVPGGAPYETKTVIVNGVHGYPAVGGELRVFVDPRQPGRVLVAEQ
jgi:hypothetical protein